MKIILSLAEALELIRDHDSLNHLEDAEITIEGYEEKESTVGTSKDAPQANTRKPRKSRKKKVEEPVNQETVNDIVAEVEAELETTDSDDTPNAPVAEPKVITEEVNEPSAVKRSSAEEQQLSLIDEVLAEEVEAPLVELDNVPAELDLDAPLFS